MEVMYLLIAASLTLATGFVIAFIWAIKNGQYDDKYTPSVRILFDDEKQEKKSEKDQNDENNNEK